MQAVSNIEDIEFEIKKALKILKSMPKVGPKNVKSHWPEYLNEEQGDFNEKKTVQYYKPLPQEIDDMDEVLEQWLKCIDYDERNLVIMRSSGNSWKLIMRKFNASRSYLYGQYVKSLKKILQYVLEKQQKTAKRDNL